MKRRQRTGVGKDERPYMQKNNINVARVLKERHKPRMIAKKIQHAKTGKTHVALTVPKHDENLLRIRRINVAYKILEKRPTQTRNHRGRKSKTRRWKKKRRHMNMSETE